MLLLAGLSHRTAPVALRETLAFDQVRAGESLRRLAVEYPGTEGVILSTCNRVELYVACNGAAQPTAEELARFLARCHQISPATLGECLYHRRQEEVAEHLFSVAGSLDSLVLGETQILAQVKQAYQTACEAGTVGTALHALFQRAFAAAKDIHKQTGLSGGHVSVASVAVELLRGVFDRFDEKTVLLVGTGKMAGLMLRSLQALHPARLIATNRSPERTARMAAQWSLEAADYNRLPELLIAADIVLTSTGSPEPILTAERIKPLLKSRHYRPLVIVDIAVPRDVEAAVGRLHNVYLYNIDDLEQVAAGNRRRRGDQERRSREIVARHTEDFMHWFRARHTGPLVRALYQHCRRIGQAEVETLLAAHPELTPQQQQAIEKLARRVVGKILHLPVTELTAPTSHPKRMHLAEAIQQLFRLAPVRPTDRQAVGTGEAAAADADVESGSLSDAATGEREGEDVEQPPQSG